MRRPFPVQASIDMFGKVVTKPGSWSQKLFRLQHERLSVLRPGAIDMFQLLQVKILGAAGVYSTRHAATPQNLVLVSSVMVAQRDWTTLTPKRDNRLANSFGPLAAGIRVICSFERIKTNCKLRHSKPGLITETQR